jgi:hypothetical protein
MEFRGQFRRQSGEIGRLIGSSGTASLYAREVQQRINEFEQAKAIAMRQQD